MDSRRRPGGAAIAACLLVCVWTGTAEGQEWGAGRIAAAFQVRVVPSTVHEFSREICAGGEFVPELRLIARPNSWFSVLVGAARHGEFGVPECDNGLHFPPPDSGIVTRSDHSSVEGYPYYSFIARTGLEHKVSDRAAMSLFAGIEWLHTKNALAPIVGTGLRVFLDEDVQLLLEVERRQFRVNTQLVTTEYRGGAPITVVRKDHDRLEVQAAFRIGFVWSLGGSAPRNEQ